MIRSDQGRRFLPGDVQAVDQVGDLHAALAQPQQHQAEIFDVLLDVAVHAERPQAHLHPLHIASIDEELVAPVVIMISVTSTVMGTVMGDVAGPPAAVELCLVHDPSSDSDLRHARPTP